jgi:hypothetical protein
MRRLAGPVSFRLRHDRKPSTFDNPIGSRRCTIGSFPRRTGCRDKAGARLLLKGSSANGTHHQNQHRARCNGLREHHICIPVGPLANVPPHGQSLHPENGSSLVNGT